MTDFCETTQRYYSQWVDYPLEQAGDRLVLVKTDRRRERQSFYHNPFCLYAVKTPERFVLSYAPDIEEQILPLASLLSPHQSAGEAVALLREKLDAGVRHSVKFVFAAKSSPPPSKAVPLTLRHWEDYRQYFWAVFPQVAKAEMEGVREHFQIICREGYCFGRYEGQQLVSVTRCPTMPYLRELVQEIGIATHPDYQGRGYALDTCSACLEKILSEGKTPLWSCSAANLPSANLARKLGFLPYADVFSLFGSTPIQV